MKKIVTVSMDVEIEIDDGTAKKCLESYVDVMDEDGDMIGMLEHIAYNVIINGQLRFIEGVGKIRGKHIRSDDAVAAVDIDYNSVCFDIEDSK